MNEAELKRAIEDYLQIGQNQGKWFYLRLNSGDFIMTDEGGSFRRRIKGCPKGTADLLVITNNGRYDAPNKYYAIPIFLELKGEKGRQTKEQGEFQDMVEAQGCGYHIIRSVDEVMEILG